MSAREIAKALAVLLVLFALALALGLWGERRASAQIVDPGIRPFDIAREHFGGEP